MNAHVHAFGFALNEVMLYCTIKARKGGGVRRRDVDMKHMNSASEEREISLINVYVKL